MIGICLQLNHSLLLIKVSFKEWRKKAHSDVDKNYEHFVKLTITRDELLSIV